jgi:hypothetical protein
MDDDGAGRWLSYAELAEARGITRKAAARLTLRHQWRRQPANDGTVRVWVPEADLSDRQTGRQGDRQTDRQDGVPSLLAQTVAALENALTEANGRADTALTLADRTLAQLADAEGRTEAAVKRADRAEARAEQERLAADRFRAEAETAQQAATLGRRSIGRRRWRHPRPPGKGRAAGAAPGTAGGGGDPVVVERWTVPGRRV